MTALIVVIGILVLIWWTVFWLSRGIDSEEERQARVRARPQSLGRAGDPNDIAPWDRL